MKKKALRVSLDVKQQSIVELTVGEKVQLDRLVPSTDCYVAERHGDLINAGATTLALPQGLYSFKTLSEASLTVVRGGVTVAVNEGTKTHWPDPPSPAIGGPTSGGPTSGGPTSGGPLASGAGDEPDGEPPGFTVR